MLDVGAAEEAVGVQQQRPHGLFVEVFHHVAAEAALLRDALEQELIVVRNAQLAARRSPISRPPLPYSLLMAKTRCWSMLAPSVFLRTRRDFVEDIVPEKRPRPERGRGQGGKDPSAMRKVAGVGTLCRERCGVLAGDASERVDVGHRAGARRFVPILWPATSPAAYRPGIGSVSEPLEAKASLRA
mgnify:CR=1 FL=1